MKSIASKSIITTFANCHLWQYSIVKATWHRSSVRFVLFANSSKIPSILTVGPFSLSTRISHMSVCCEMAYDSFIGCHRHYTIFENFQQYLVAGAFTAQIDWNGPACKTLGWKRKKASSSSDNDGNNIIDFTVAAVARLLCSCTKHRTLWNCRSGKGRFHFVALKIIVGQQKIAFFSFFLSFVASFRCSRYADAPSNQNVAVIVGMGPFMLEMYHTGAEVNDKNNLFCFGWSVGGGGGVDGDRIRFAIY